MKTKLITIALFLGTCGAYAQHDHAVEKADKKTNINMTTFNNTQLGIAYEHYLHLKDALVSSNAQEAKAGAKELQQAIKDISGSATASEAAVKISVSSDLKEQRKVFSTLSNELATLIKSDKLSMGVIYIDYCPMANKNEGAYWLSSQKEIKNPYFGNAMLKCGSIKETIQ